MENTDNDVAFEKWLEDNWTAITFSGTSQETGYYVHKSNDVKVENFNRDELKQMFAEGYEPVILHPTFAEAIEEMHNKKNNQK